MTTNLGLSYVLSSIRQMKYSTGRSWSEDKIMLTDYRNNVSQDCSPPWIQMSFEKRSILSQVHSMYDYWKGSIHGDVNCEMYTEHGRFDLLFRTVLLVDNKNMDDLSPEGPGDYVAFGTDLVGSWFTNVILGIMYDPKTATKCDSPDTRWNSFDIRLSLNDNASNYRVPNYFMVDASFTYTHLDLPSAVEDTPMHDFMASTYLPGMGISLDAFGTASGSLILSDFGNYSSINALTNREGILYLQFINDTVLASLSASFENQITDDISNHFVPGCIDQVLDPTETLEPQAQSKTTRVFAQYLCSIPRAKPTMSLILAVVLADMVFLSTAWHLFQLFTTTWILPNTQIEWNTCGRCLE